MKTLRYIIDKFGVDPQAESPVELDCAIGDLARLFGELGFKRGAEIGVDYGHKSAIFCEENSGLRLYCIDPWEVYGEYDDVKDQGRLSASFDYARNALAKYNCKIVRKLSADAVKDFKPGSLDFVYIDANHRYEYVLEDIKNWSKIVRRGGIVSGHDYKALAQKPNPNPGVGRAVDEYVEKSNIGMFFKLVKKNDSSWFWVKDR